MYDTFVEVLQQTPGIALFLSLAIGYAIGQIKFGPIQLGGVCGTLIAALLIGQLGVTVDNGVKNVFFMLFIFALGYAGGPQFFANLNAKGLRLAVLCLIEVVVVLALVLTATKFLHLDPGTAAGMMAGAATESAVVGTATDAISKLPLPPEQIHQLQANVVTAYSITYIFGLITIVIVTSQLFPLILRVSLREEAEKLWLKMSGNKTGVDDVNVFPDIVGRAYRFLAQDQTIGSLQATLKGMVHIARVRRHGDYLNISKWLTLRKGDEILVLGQRQAIAENNVLLGNEFADNTGLNMPVHCIDVLVQNTALFDQPLEQLNPTSGMHIMSVRRGEYTLPALPALTLQHHDILQIYAENSLNNKQLDLAISDIGKRLSASVRSNITYAGLGIVAGVIIGGFSIRLSNIPFSLGTGGGVLLTGLVFGWYQAKRPDLLGIPAEALALLKDIGLASFIACVGLSSGPQAIQLIKQYGISLPLIGVVIAVVPASISLLVGHVFLKLEAPVLLGAIAGQQCSTPALSAIQNAAGNSTPLLGYTITYAVSNIVLPLMGPLIVGLVSAMQP